ncbi:permease [Neobacillus niacini]|nr:permease [Neobacillus niacini]MCM3691723.1 permease [Neobacillus niacini]
MNTIFISILIEAFPFILLGVLISGIIQIFVSEEMMARIIPKNKILAVFSAAIIGAIFPACECGIVPITRRLPIMTARDDTVPLPASKRDFAGR